MCFLFFLSFLFFKVNLADWKYEFAHNTYLDNDYKYRLFWSKLNESFIEFGVQCESLGWVGFGISAEGFMTNSDIAFGWIGTDNKCYLQHRHTGSKHVVPILDTSSDLTLVQCFRVGNITSFRFIRPIHPCNGNATEIVDGTTNIIYSWNNNNIPDITDFDNTVEWHDTNRGSTAIYLLANTTFNVTLESNTKTFDILNSNYTIPSVGTTYNCKLVKLPVVNRPNHITKFGPVISPGNINLVHHMLVYNCPASLAPAEEVGHTEECSSYRNSNLTSAGCVFGTVIFAWAVGAEDFTVPSEVGFLLGGSSGSQYVILEIHYNNVYQVSNVKDSSGIRIYYTPTLRKYNASTIEMGLMVDGYSQFLPPGASSLVNFGYCDERCTGSGIPENGTNIFATFLHAHIHGTALSLRQIRDGVELPRIDSNWHYDFNYQATTAHTTTIKLLPNDTLILECYYQTLDSNHTIFSGLSTSNEMCLVFIYVYPPVTLSTCDSSHYYSDIQDWASIAYDNQYLTNLDTFYYDLNVDGALEWYDALWNNYTNRMELCADHNYRPLINNSNVTFLKESKYEVYNVSTPCIPFSDIANNASITLPDIVTTNPSSPSSFPDTTITKLLLTASSANLLYNFNYLGYIMFICITFFVVYH